MIGTTIFKKDQDQNIAYKVSAIALALIFFGFAILSKSLLRDLMYIAIPFWVYVVYKEWNIDYASKYNLIKLLLLFLFLANTSIIWSSPLSIEEAWSTIKSTIFSLLFLSILLILANRAEVDRLIKYLIIGAVISAVLSLLLSLENGGFLSSRLELIGGAKNPNIGGFLLAWSLLCLVCLSDKIIVNKALYSVCTVILTVGLFLTQSRSSIVALIAALLMIVWASRDCRRTLYYAVGTLSLVFVFLALGAYFAYDEVTTRADSYRLDIWHKTMLMILDNPVLGHGMASPFEVIADGGLKFTSAHNVYLSTAYHMGLLGLAIFIIMIFIMLKTGWQYARNDEDYLLFGILFFGCVTGMFEFQTMILNLNREWLVWLLPIALYVKSMHAVRVKNYKID